MHASSAVRYRWCSSASPCSLYYLSESELRSPAATPAMKAKTPSPRLSPRPAWQTGERTQSSAASVYAAECSLERNECDSVCSAPAPPSPAPDARDGWDRTSRQKVQYSCGRNFFAAREYKRKYERQYKNENLETTTLPGPA